MLIHSADKNIYIVQFMTDDSHYLLQKFIHI